MDFVIGDFYHLSYDTSKYALDVHLTLNDSVDAVPIYNNVFSLASVGTLRASIVDVAAAAEGGVVVFEGEFEVVPRTSAYTELHVLVITPGGFASPLQAEVVSVDEAGVLGMEADTSNTLLPGLSGFDAAYIDSDFWSGEIHLGVRDVHPDHALVGAMLLVAGRTSRDVDAATLVRSTVTRTSGTTISMVLSATPDLHIDFPSRILIRFVFAFRGAAANILPPTTVMSQMLAIQPRPASRSRCILSGTLLASETIASGDIIARPHSLVLTLDSETWADGVENDVPAIIDAIIGSHTADFVASDRWFTAEGLAARGAVPQNEVSVLETLRAATCDRPDASTGSNRLVLVTSSSIVPRLLHPETLLSASVLPSRFIRSGRSDIPMITSTSSVARIHVHPSGGEVMRVEQNGARYDRDFWEVGGDFVRITIVVQGDHWQPINTNTVTDETRSYLETHIRRVLTANMDMTSSWAMMINTADLAVSSNAEFLHIDIGKQTPSSFRLDAGGINILMSVGATATDTGPPLLLSGNAPTATYARLIVLPIPSSAIVTRIDIGEAELWKPETVITHVSLTDGNVVRDHQAVRASLEVQLQDQLSIPDLSLQPIPEDVILTLKLTSALSASQTRLFMSVALRLVVPGAHLRNASDIELPVITVTPAAPAASFSVTVPGEQSDTIVSSRTMQTVGCDLRVSLMGDAISRSDVDAVIMRARTDSARGWNATVLEKTSVVRDGVDVIIIDVHVVATSSYAPASDEVIDVFVSGDALVKGRDLHAGSFVVNHRWEAMREFQRELEALDEAHSTVRSIIFAISALKRSARESTDGSTSTSILSADQISSTGGRFLASDGVTARLRKLTNPMMASNTSMPMEVSDIPLLLGAVRSIDAIVASETVVTALQTLAPALKSRLAPGATLPQIPIFVGVGDPGLVAVEARVVSYTYRVVVLPRSSYDEVHVDIVARGDEATVLRSTRYPRNTRVFGATVHAATEAICVHGEDIVKTVG